MSFDTANKFSSCGYRCTVAMRDKERLQDYRFMAEPNLPCVLLSDEDSQVPHVLSIKHIEDNLPPLRPSIRLKLLGYGLSLEKAVTILVSLLYVLINF